MSHTRNWFFTLSLRLRIKPHNETKNILKENSEGMQISTGNECCHTTFSTDKAALMTT